MPISDSAYIPPTPTVNYTVATTNAYGISAAKNRIENAQALAPLFKPGTNMAHLFSACKIRNCTMPDYEAFESFKRYAVNSSSYFNDICALLAFPDGHAPELSVITPRWDMERFYDQYSASGVTCRPTESYLMQARAINSAAVDRRNYWLMAIGIPLVLIYIFVVFTTSRWK